MTRERVPPVRRDDATPEQRRIGDRIFGSRSEPYGGPSAILLHIPHVAERFEALRESLVREQALPEPVVHLAALITARHFSARYAWWKRAPLCVAAGIPDEAIEAIRQRQRPDLSDATLAAAHGYVEELLERQRVSDETHDRALALFGQRPLIELASIVGLYSMLALLCDAFEPALPPDVSDPFPDTAQGAAG